MILELTTASQLVLRGITVQQHSQLAASTQRRWVVEYIEKCLIKIARSIKLIRVTGC